MSLADIAIWPGQRVLLEQVRFTAQAYGPIQAVLWWEPGYQEPIYLITNLELADEACYWYRRRMRIETFFSDQKSRGFQLHKSHLADPPTPGAPVDCRLSGLYLDDLFGYPVSPAGLA